MPLSNHSVGNLSMMLYVIITVLSTMLIHDTNQYVSPFLSAFYTFLFCLIVYGYAIYGLFGKLDLLFDNRFNIAMLNMTTAICWLFSFMSLKYLPPDLFLFVFICAMPITHSALTKTRMITSGLFISGIIFFSLTYHVDRLMLGVVLAFIGGVSGALYSVYSKKIVTLFSTPEILSLRFFLTVLLTLIANIYFHSFQLLEVHYYIGFALLSVVSVILPLLFYQTGIKNLDVSRVISYLPMAPLLCYLIHMLFDGSKIDITQLIVVLFLFFVMVFNFALAQK